MAWTEKQRKAHSARMKKIWAEKKADAELDDYITIREDSYSSGSIYDSLRDIPAEMEHDPVDHPNHYRKHPSGIECIEVTEHMNFCRGNAIKYIWRAGEKGSEVEDLKKAVWYINREIERVEQKARIENANG